MERGKKGEREHKLAFTARVGRARTGQERKLGCNLLSWGRREKQTQKGEKQWRQLLCKPPDIEALKRELLWLLPLR